jgi:hypothetical protein
MCWWHCADVLMCWCVDVFDVLICWCVGCVDMMCLMCWCVDVSDVSMCNSWCVSMCWCFWCVDVFDVLMWVVIIFSSLTEIVLNEKENENRQIRRSMKANPCWVSWAEFHSASKKPLELQPEQQSSNVGRAFLWKFSKFWQNPSATEWVTPTPPPPPPHTHTHTHGVVYRESHFFFHFLVPYFSSRLHFFAIFSSAGKLLTDIFRQESVWVGGWRISSQC